MFGVCVCPGDALGISLVHLKMRNELFATYTSSSLELTILEDKVRLRFIQILTFWCSREFA